MVDWRGFGTEEWGAGRPAESPAASAPDSSPKQPEPSPGEGESMEAASSPPDEGREEPGETVAGTLVTGDEAQFLRERVEQLERSVDRLEQLVGRAQELHLAEQRAHDETRHQLTEAQARVIGLLEAPREAPTPSPGGGAPAASATRSHPAPPASSAAAIVTRDLRVGLMRLSRWLRG